MPPLKWKKAGSELIGNSAGVQVAELRRDFGWQLSCQQRLGDRELAAYCPLGGDWDSCYIGVLAAIAACRSGRRGACRPQPRQLQFSFIEPNC
jgi:hypothetical protein